MTRLFCKAYEAFLQAMNLFAGRHHTDPSKILIDYFTREQHVAQSELDALAIARSDILSGELLVLIPFKDRADLTMDCLQDLNRQNFPASIKIRTVLLNNQSSDSKSLEKLSHLKSQLPNLSIDIQHCNYPFNYSRINNDGFRLNQTPETKWILFLNNDVKLTNIDTIQTMLLCLDKNSNASAVGCTLLYQDQTIQHLFAAPGVKIIAAHPLKGQKYNQITSWNAKPFRPVPTVTGAVCMVRRSDFESVGGFDEQLPTMGQDIDLCLRLNNIRNSYCVSLTAFGNYHLEGASKLDRLNREESSYFYRKWANQKIASRFYSDQFSRWSEQPLLKFFPEPQYPASFILIHR